MIKFFKEIFSSIKEGIEEGKQELAEERKLKNEQDNIDGIQIENLSYTESFGNALGAPFRVIIFGDWFTLFKKIDESTEEYYPAHLYIFGSYKRLKDVKEDFTKKLKQDFGIVDTNSCLRVLSSFLDITAISKKDTQIENIEPSEISIDYSKLSESRLSAVVTCIISYITTASTDIGYIDKKDALIILDKTIDYIKSYHNDWSGYALSFMEGQSQIKLNNFAGKPILEKYIKYLESKKGSPWNNLNW